MVMNSARKRWVMGAVLAFGAVTITVGHAQNPPAASSPIPAVIDFNWHIRPILSDNCLQCHGPNDKSRQANLRLDVADSAYAERGAPTRPRRPVVPGDPDNSELIRRVTNPNPAARMPPQSTHKTLSPSQIALLRAWIAQGAKYKPHWAYLPVVKPLVPAAAIYARSAGDIDRFIAARLQQEGLKGSAEADKETLINRVSLTLTG